MAADMDLRQIDAAVSEARQNSFEGAEFRHPAGSRRQVVIAEKYGGSASTPDSACNPLTSL